MDRIVSFFHGRIESSTGSHVAGVIAATAVAVSTTYFLYGQHMRRKISQRMRSRAEKSKAKLEALRVDLVKHGANVEDGLVKLSFRDLQGGLQNGTITAVAALLSYQAKALAVNDEINCITDALEDAKVTACGLDSLPKSQRGPLHGVPISLKESCGIKGHDCTVGFGELIDLPRKEDSSVLVQVLKAKGAVPFIRTNLPQGMKSFSCSNPIFGETCNPHNRTRSPGGSSGGEGAIIGADGSILGVGSDIGGSIRIPACFCGVYALKPTYGRLSSEGNFGYRSLTGQTIVQSTYGPLGRDVDSLVKFMEAVLCPELFRLDPATASIPFRRDIYENQRPLKIGYYVYDGCTRCVPAVERAVMLAKAALETLGHTGYNPVVIEAMKREQIRTVSDWFLKRNEAKKFVKEFMATWQEQSLDAVICPCMPCVATTTGVDSQLLSAVTYTSIYNVVNFPAGTLPVTEVLKSDVEKTMDPTFYSAKTGIEKIIQTDSEGTEGLPVGIQVAGLPYTEEVVLRLMTELDGALKSMHQTTGV